MRTACLGLLIGAGLLGGCRARGDSALQRDHLAYNEAISTSETRELLLNIVRLRYADPIKFLSVDHVTTSFTVNVGATGHWGASSGDPDWRIGPSAGYSSTPTLTFTPQGGAAFAENLLQPPSLDHVVLMLDSMDDVENGLCLLVNAINGTRDGEGEAGSVFRRHAKVLGELRDDEKIGFQVVRARDELSVPIPRSGLTAADVLAAAKDGYAYEKSGDDDVVLVGTKLTPTMLIHDDAADAQDQLRSLGIEPGRGIVPLKAATDVEMRIEGSGAMYLSPRSVLAMMSVLARGVEVPEAHRCAGIVPPVQVLPGSGGPGDLIRIRSSTQRPPERPAVLHRGYWFWIDDADTPSKESFTNLMAFYALRLKSGPSDASQPVLTLSASGG